MYCPPYINNINNIKNIKLKGTPIPEKYTIQNIKCENLINLNTYFKKRLNNDYSTANQLLLKKILSNIINNQVYIENKINEIINNLISLYKNGNMYTYYKNITKSTDICHKPNCNGIIHINTNDNIITTINSAINANIGDTILFIMSTKNKNEEISNCTIKINNNETFQLQDGITIPNIIISTGTTLKLICTNINNIIHENENENIKPNKQWLAILETTLKL